MRVVLTGQSLLRSDFRVKGRLAMDTISPLLQGDAVFTNLETAIREQHDSVAGLDPLTGMWAPPEALDCLTDLGVNLLALSNNHAFNLGAVGVANAVDHARRRAMAVAGAGADLAAASAPGYVATARGTIGLVSTASGFIEPEAAATLTSAGVNELRLVDGAPAADDAARILAAIREAAERADVVVSYHHNHVYDIDFAMMLKEQRPERLVPPGWVRTWAHAQVDAGADIVVMHGAPLLQGVEVYAGSAILYDLGNFIFELPLGVDDLGVFHEEVWESAVATVVFEGGRLAALRLVPIVVKQYDDATTPRGLPVPAAGAAADRILLRLVAVSALLGTEVTVAAGGVDVAVS